MLRYSLAFVVALGAVGAARAETSAAVFFDGLTRDFGAVPHGATLTHSFWLTNKTGGPVRISGVRVSCGCVTATAATTELAPGQATAIVAQMDSRRFSGFRTVSIFVGFDQPFGEEVQLSVQATSRDDLVFRPETLSFGDVKAGATPTASMQMTFFGGDEQVVEAKSASKFVEVTYKELAREAGQVRYEVTARLRPGLPVGHWSNDVWLTTGTAGAPKVLVPVTVQIVSAGGATQRAASRR